MLISQNHDEIINLFEKYPNIYRDFNSNLFEAIPYAKYPSVLFHIGWLNLVIEASKIYNDIFEKNPKCTFWIKYIGNSGNKLEIKIDTLEYYESLESIEYSPSSHYDKLWKDVNEAKIIISSKSLCVCEKCGEITIFSNLNKFKTKFCKSCNEYLNIY